MRSRPTYLTVVTTLEALEQSPPRLVSSPAPIPPTDEDWQALLHAEANLFDWRRLLARLVLC